MKTARIKLTAITDKKDSDFAVLVKEIHDGVVANLVTFPAPVPGMLELNNQLTDLVAKGVKAADGSHDAINARNLQRAVVTVMLFQLAGYVTNVAGTKETFEEQKAIIELAKFTVAKTGSPIGPLGKVLDVKANWTGMEGQVVVSWKKIKGGYNYLVQKTTSDPANNPVWQDLQITSRRKIVISGLSPLSRVWIRVIAYGAYPGGSIPSDPAMSVVG